MKKILNTVYSPLVTLLWNLLLVFLTYQIARMAFYLENSSYLNYTSDVFLGGLLFDTSAIFYTNALYIVLMLFPFYRKENDAYHNVCKWIFIVINALALAINLADAVYFQYTMRRTTSTVFREFSNENNLWGVVGTEFLRHWYFVVLFIVVMVLLWKLYAKPRLNYKQMLHRWAYSLVCLLSLLVMAPLCIAGMRGGFTTAVRPITISNANQYAARPTDAALVLNTPFSIIRTIGKDVFAVPNYYSNEQELENIYSPVHFPIPSERLGEAPKKNVVILIVESFGREYIGALNKNLENGQYKGYTPFVDSLIAQSVTFTHSYCNGRKSIDGMPSILSSIPMFVEPFFLTPASMNNVGGIASLLADEGYQTAFFHGAQRGSMGFQAFARKTGFQDYFGREDYNEDRRFGGDSDFDGMWAIWDEPFLQYYATKMSEMKEPFMTAVFTASSHHPYAIPEKYKETYPEESLIIHKCIRYTDMAIGKFFETARRQPWFQNTIFVLTSDHTNLSDHAYYQTDLGGFCSPIIIYEPGRAPEIQDKIAQQIDILPTLMAMLGYQKPYFAFGIDLLNTPAEETWAVNYLNGIYQYVKNGHVLQFDGKQTVALYALTDSLMKNNLIGKSGVMREARNEERGVRSEELSTLNSQLEKELKAIIQQYMTRMTQDRLQP